MEKVDIRTNPNLIIVLGEYIRSKRVEKGIGLREMAEHLSISPAYLSNLESGKHPMVNPLLLKKISKKNKKKLYNVKKEIIYHIKEN